MMVMLFNDWLRLKVKTGDVQNRITASDTETFAPIEPMHLVSMFFFQDRNVPQDMVNWETICTLRSRVVMT